MYGCWWIVVPGFGRIGVLLTLEKSLALGEAYAEVGLSWHHPSIFQVLDLDLHIPQVVFVMIVYVGVW